MVTAEEARALRARISELEARAAAVEAQAELARTLPHVVARATPQKNFAASRCPASTLSEVTALSVARRWKREAHQRRRAAEDSARSLVARACRAVQSCGVPIVQVTRRLALSDRTARRWRREALRAGSVARGRPPRCASRDERCAVYRFLQPRGAGTPLAAVQAPSPCCAAPTWPTSCGGSGAS